MKPMYTCGWNLGMIYQRKDPWYSIPPHKYTLQWRHNERNGVSNHQPHDCLLNRISQRRSKKISKPRVTGLCEGIHRGPVSSPHKGPVTRKMLPFDDAIMTNRQAYILAKMQILASNNLPKCKFWQVITPLTLWQQNKVIPDTGIPIIKIGGHYNVNLYIGKIALEQHMENTHMYHCVRNWQTPR